MNIHPLRAGGDSPLTRAIASVSVLGVTGPAKWEQQTDALHITLPATAPGPGVCTLKIALR